MNKIKELQAKRDALQLDSQRIVDSAKTENRGLTSDEETRANALIGQIKAIDKEIEELRASAPAPAPMSHAQAGGDAQKDEYRSAFNRFVRTGDSSELRAMVKGTNSAGGFLVPSDLVDEILKAPDNPNYLTSKARRFDTTSDAEFPVVVDAPTVDIVAEEGGDGTDDFAVGKVTLGAHKISHLIKVSEELLADSAYDVEALVREELGKAILAKFEAYFFLGTGSGQPQGIKHSSAGSLFEPTGSVTALTYDMLVDFVHTMSQAYRPGSVLFVSTEFKKRLLKLKDSTNAPIFGPRDTDLFGFPIQETPNITGTWTNGNVHAIMLNPKYYIAGFRRNIGFQRLDELYAANGFVGFRMHLRGDAKLAFAAADVKFSVTT